MTSGMRLSRLLTEIHSVISRSLSPYQSAVLAGKCRSRGLAHSAAPFRHHIWVSTCHDIYSNLALEDWLYTNFTFDNREVFLLWSNDPCIVIGRHQNPWTECSVSTALSESVKIARRNSGGGTVFHDQGNLCCSFFTSRKKYNRRKNLEQIVSALRRNFQLDVAVSDRDDILLEKQYKISGTAAKLGRQVAYHHCTVLLDVDTAKLQDLLISPMCITSRATESVKSEVKNTKEVDGRITYETAIAALVDEYQLGHKNLAEFMHVDPTRERHFPGIHTITEGLKQWEWIYGKTPPFTLQESFTQLFDGTSVKLSVKLGVEKGCMKDVCIQTDTPFKGQKVLQAITMELKGKRFCFTTIDGAMKQVSQEASSHGEVVAWVWKCFRELFR